MFIIVPRYIAQKKWSSCSQLGKTKLILYAGKTAQKSEEKQLNPWKNILMFIC